MKRSLKLLVSTVTAVAILATSAMMSLADGTGKITVTNATANETYAAYKIFNADVNGASVNYTLNGDKTSDANKALLETTGSPFTASATGDISVSATAKDDDIIKFVKGVIANNESAFTKIDPTSVSGQTVIFDNLDFGYYFVSSTLGTAVSITSATPTATVVDKNDMPSWNPQPVDPNQPTVTPPTDLPTPPAGTTTDGKFVSETGENGSYAKVSTSGVNQKEFFMISAHCPALAGSNKVVSYIFTDVLDNGFTFVKDENVALYTNVNGVLTKVTSGFSYVVDGQKITFTYVVPSNYAGAELVIKYTATTDKDAVYDNVNKVDMDWTFIPADKTANDYDDDPTTDDKPSIPSTQDPDYPGSPSNTTTPTKPAGPKDDNYDPAFPPTPNTSKTDTYVYQFELIKVDATDESKVLEKAEFKLYSDADCTDEIKVVAATGDYDYRVADTAANETEATIIAGQVKIFGLDKGTYYVKETKAPDNYNLLKTPESVTITSALDTTATVKVKNSKGSELPSTGGMGTTIFIVAGSVLMAGAFIGIITKKRMSLKDEEQ